MTTVSPVSILNEGRPDALARRTIGAARELTADAGDALRRHSFRDLVRGLDANDDGRLTAGDAVGLAARGVAKVASVLTGVDIDTTGLSAEPRSRVPDIAALGITQRDRPAEVPAIVPPTVEGIHQLYDTLRAMR